MSDVREPAETTAQLRARIDAGETGEKVGHPDPAAAPLGTDAEAGGVSPTVAETRAAQQRPIRPFESGARPGHTTLLPAVFIAVVSLAIILVLALSR